MYYFLKLFCIFLLLSPISNTYALDCRKLDEVYLKAKKQYYYNNFEASLSIFQELIKVLEEDTQEFEKLNRNCQLTLIESYLYGSQCHFILKKYDSSLAYLENLQKISPNHSHLKKTMSKFIDKRPKKIHPILHNYPQLAALYDFPEIQTVSTTSRSINKGTCQQLRDKYFVGLHSINESSYNLAIELFSDILTEAKQEVPKGDEPKICNLLIRDCYTRAAQSYYELSEIEQSVQLQEDYMTKALTYIRKALSIEKALSVDKDSSLAQYLYEKINIENVEEKEEDVSIKIEWVSPTSEPSEPIFGHRENIYFEALILSKFPLVEDDFQLSVNDISGSKGSLFDLDIKETKDKSTFPYQYILNFNRQMKYQKNEVFILFLPEKGENVQSAKIIYNKLRRVGGDGEKIKQPKTNNEIERKGNKRYKH